MKTPRYRADEATKILEFGHRGFESSGCSPRGQRSSARQAVGGGGRSFAHGRPRPHRGADAEKHPNERSCPPKDRNTGPACRRYLTGQEIANIKRVSRATAVVDAITVVPPTKLSGRQLSAARPTPLRSGHGSSAGTKKI